MKSDRAKKKGSRCRAARRALLFWTLFIGLGAVAGALGMLLDPSGKTMGMDAMLPYFQKLPFADTLFRDLTFSGWALLFVNGVTNLIAAALLLCRRKSGVLLGGAFGITLMLWILIQFYMFPLNFMSTVYFIFGFCQAATGYAAYVFGEQEAFSFSPKGAGRIGSDPTKLVIYFSRMGYTKKVAYEEAERTGASLYEIKATEMTDGTRGFWWCGRYGMHRWPMPIEPIQLDLSAYAEVTVCSPIWVFSLAAPVRNFLGQAKGKIGHVNYIFVHYTSWHYRNAAKEADARLGIPHDKVVEVRCRFGHFRVL